MSEALDRYVAAMEATQTTSIDDIMAFFAEDARFRDPFSDIRGKAKIRRVFEKTHEDLDDIRITVTDRATGTDAHYIRWIFKAVPKGFLRRQGEFVIDGMTEVHINDNGLVTAHLDYWDPTPHVWQRIPLMGTALGALRRQVGVR